MPRLTLHNAFQLIPGNAIHLPRPGNPNGCERWKVSGQVKTWKKNPGRIRVPLKHGLRHYSAINETDFDSQGNATYPFKDSEIVKPGMPCSYCGMEH